MTFRLGAALILAAFAGGCAPARPPNLVLLVVDDLRADHLPSYGYERDTAPFVSELAQAGVLFDNVVSQSSWTKTSMASMLSSLNPDAHGVRKIEDVLADDIVLLPEVLQEAGYRTLSVHGNPWMENRFGFNQGYDYFVYSHWHNEGIRAERVWREAIQWLGDEPEQPFFLYLHFMDVHAPFEAPDGYDVFGEGVEDAYDASMLYVDAQLRVLYERLERLGVLDDTWIVFTSDHGEEFGEHGRPDGHGATLYREVVDVPLLFHHPRRTAGSNRRVEQVRLIDIAPTLLDLAGLEPPEAMQGESLRAAIEGDVRLSDRLAVSRVGGNDVAPDSDLFSFATRELKYVVDFATGREELFDRTSDPLEQRNVARSRPDVVERMRRQASVVVEVERALRSGKEASAEIDEKLREELRALGYLK